MAEEEKNEEYIPYQCKPNEEGVDATSQRHDLAFMPDVEIPDDDEELLPPGM